MKRLLEDGSDDAKSLVGALRGREVDPFMHARVLGRVQSGGARAVNWKLKPAGVLSAIAVVVLASAASAAIWRAAHRPVPSLAAYVESQRAPVVEPPVVVPVLEAPHAKPTLHKLFDKVRVEPEPPRATSDPEESRLLLEAYRALRQENDTEMACSRVDEYLRRFPKGPLTEEALVIALDATAGDLVHAVVYAKRYLRDVPGGRRAGRARAIVEKE